MVTANQTALVVFARRGCRVLLCVTYFMVAHYGTLVIGEDRPRDGFEIYREALASRSEMRDLEARRSSVISGSLVMNTVRQFSDIRSLEPYLAERSEEASIWDKLVADGAARRIGVVNPYASSTYAKYYDDTGGWRFSVIDNDFRATQKLRDDWAAAYKRARATLDGLSKEYDALVADQGLPAAQRAELGGMISSATKRMDQFGTPPLELLPRPVAGELNSPFPTYKAFDSYTGRVIRIGRTSGESREISTRPSAGNDEQPSAPPIASRPGIGGTAWEWADWTRPRSYPRTIDWRYLRFDVDGRFFGSTGEEKKEEGVWQQQGDQVRVRLRWGTLLLVLRDGHLENFYDMEYYTRIDE